MAALTEMAIWREAEPGPDYLTATSLQLSKEPSLELVLRAVRSIGRTERREGESALPSLGRILREMRSIAAEDANLPFRHLRGLVRKMAVNFGVEPSDDLLQCWQDLFGHRTDADLDEGYKSVMRNPELKRMPTTGQFQSILPLLKMRRDGTRVQ